MSDHCHRYDKSLKADREQIRKGNYHCRGFGEGNNRLTYYLYTGYPANILTAQYNKKTPLTLSHDNNSSAFSLALFYCPVQS